MITFIYTAAYFYLAIVMIRLIKSDMKINEKFLLFTVALIPLGKLVYMPFANSPGLKVSFLFGSVLAMISLLIYLNNKMDRRLLFLFMLIYPATISLLFLKDKSMFLYFQFENGQTESVFLRYVTLILLIVFSISIATYIQKNDVAFSKIASYYTHSLFFSVAVGAVIFTGVFQGSISYYDLLPISADTHIVGKYYRFNPGSNVNEFGMLLGYGMIFLLTLEWGWKRKYLYLTVFIVAEFLTLTRAAWIGVVIGAIVYCLLNRLINFKWIMIASVFVGVALLVFNSNQELNYLLTSRSALDIGASGEERLGKYAYIFEGISESVVRMFFGFGWSTNLYAHSVPLQLLYETGLIGLLSFTVIGGYIMLQFMIKYPKGKIKNAMLSMIVMCIIFSLVHHTFYHMQTWILIGIIWGLTIKESRSIQLKLFNNHINIPKKQSA